MLSGEATAFRHIAFFKDAVSEIGVSATASQGVEALVAGTLGRRIL